MIFVFFDRHPNLCLNRAFVWLCWMYKYTATSDQNWDVTPMPHVETVTVTTRLEPFQQIFEGFVGGMLQGLVLVPSQ